MTKQQDEKLSLAEFAAAHAPAPRCLLCAVPAEVEKQAREGKAAKVPYKVLGRWLDHMGYPGGTKGRLERHFQNGHIHPSLETQELDQ